MGTQLYTILIRGVPDLLLMLLIFYGVQTGLSRLTHERVGPTSKSTPFTAGVLTLGFIYGAYFTETSRRAAGLCPRPVPGAA